MSLADTANSSAGMHGQRGELRTEECTEREARGIKRYREELEREE